VPSFLVCVLKFWYSVKRLITIATLDWRITGLQAYKYLEHGTGQDRKTLLVLVFGRWDKAVPSKTLKPLD
jgi:hypothetical protein